MRNTMEMEMENSGYIAKWLKSNGKFQAAKTTSKNFATKFVGPKTGWIRVGGLNGNSLSGDSFSADFKNFLRQNLKLFLCCF